MLILVAVASRHGSTREIAEAIGDELTDAGHEVTVAEAAAVPSVLPYDAVLLGSAVYMGQWLKEARTFAARHQAALREREVWLYSSGPLGEPPHPPPGTVDVTAIMAMTQARGHEVFAGALALAGLSLAERAVVRAVKAPAGDYRDWDAIAAWARGIASALDVAPQGV